MKPAMKLNLLRNQTLLALSLFRFPIFCALLLFGFNGYSKAGAEEVPQLPVQKVVMPDIMVTAPALVAPGEPFLIMYRTRPVTPVRIRLEAEVETRREETTEFTRIKLEGPDLTASSGKRQCVLKAPGVHYLTLTFSRENAGTIKKKISIKVLNTEELQKMAGATSWTLPDKAIYISPGAETKWSEVPNEKREQIRLEPKTFAPLKPVPEGENEWWPIEAWNEISSMLHLEWLPERNMVMAFENAARPSRDRVAYAAYIRNNYRIIFQTEIGRQSWIYIERPANLNVSKNAAQIENILPDSLLLPGTSFVARAFNRHRALKPDGTMESVHILLIHITQPSQVHLKMPGYK